MCANTRGYARITPQIWLPFGYPARPILPAPGRVRDGQRACFWVDSPMTWRQAISLTKLREGCTFLEAATAAGANRKTLYRWQRRSPDFAAAVAQAREAGQAERTYRLWLRHPFRGKRPPTGKGHGGRPRFTYGRR